jgi:sugar diacid utilization regulator
MSAIAQRPLTGSEAGVNAERENRRYRDALAALSQLIEAVSEDGDLDVLLRLVARRTCETLSIRHCAVYLRAEGRSVFVGRAGHPAAEIEPSVRRLTLGGPADEITAQIVSTRRPVVIRDAYTDSRASLAAIRSWKLRSLIGVPILLGTETIGILILDNGETPRNWQSAEIDIACSFAALASAAIVRSDSLCQLRAQLDTAHRQNRLLRATRTADHRLSEALLSGGGLTAIVEVVSEVTGKATALYDVGGRGLASATPSGAKQVLPVRLFEDARGDERVLGPLRQALAGGSVTVGPLLEAGVRHRHLVAPVDVGGDRSGWLTILERPSRLTAFDEFVLRRAATHVALELAGRRTVSASQADARAALARQLLRGTAAADDARRDAEHLGIDLDAARAVVYVKTVVEDERESSRLESERLTEELRVRLRTEVLAAKGPEGIALLVNLPGAAPPRSAVRSLKRAVLETLEATVDGAEVVAGISSVCHGAAALPNAYREARDVAGCVERFGGPSPRRLLAADDLGPGRLFIANTNAAAIERFIDDVLGPLLVGEETTGELLRTLEAFYETGRSVRLASERLGVHENTIRYRLSRVQSITGLDVASSADDQLSVQVALLGLRLKGHPSLRPLESDVLAATSHGAERR